MGLNSGVNWTDHSWGPWRGCNPVSAGCQNCYARREMERYGRDFDTITRAANATFRLPLSPKVKAGERVFVGPWTDVFHANVPREWRDEAWDIMARRFDVTFIIPTKRPERIAECLPQDWGGGYPNVWLGVTAENQAAADVRAPLLLQTPAAVRFVSCEPLLGSLDLSPWLPCPIRPVCAHCGNETSAIGYCNDDVVLNCRCGREHTVKHAQWIRQGLDWVIVGGESGPNARPMHPQWVRSLRDQCQAAGAAFWFKQWGEWLPLDHASRDQIASHRDAEAFRDMPVYRVGVRNAGAVLDGREWREYPEATR